MIEHPRSLVALALTGGLVIGLTGTAVAADPDEVRSVATQVSLALPDSVGVGVDTMVGVQVQPAAQRDVELQVKSVNSNWQTVASGLTDAAGAGELVWKPLTGTVYTVRAVVPAGGGAGRVISPEQAVTPKYGITVPDEVYDPMTPGRLTVKPRAQLDADLGDYRVRIDAGVPARGYRAAARGLGVTVTDSRGRVAWASRPGKAFVSASRNTTDWVWRSEAGAFFPSIHRTARLTGQSITSAKRSGDRVTISGRVRGGGETARYTMVLREVERSRRFSAVDLTVSTPKTDAIDSVMLTAHRGRNTPVHGFGEQYRPFDLSGEVLPILVQEQGVTRGQLPAAPLVDLATWGAGNLNTTYAPWPSYVTGQKRSFELTDTLPNGAFALADMRDPATIRLESFQPGMTARIQSAGSPKQLMAARGAGWQRPELADWIQQGAVLGLQGGTAFVRKVVSEMQAAGTEISGVWLQDWVGKRVTRFGEQLWWTWQLNRTTYPGWSKMVKDFRKDGIRVMTYINPFVIDVDEVNGQPVKNWWKIGERKGYLVKNQRGKTYVVETIGFPTAMVDLTNPKARDWYADIIADEVLGKGASGFMADFGEYLPMDSVVHTGTALDQHNRYPRLWAKTVREGCQRGGVPDCVSFFRAGYSGSAKDVPLFWAGDQMVNYAVEDGLESAIKGMLAGGVSGAPLWHSDIGGYTSVDAVVENFIRPPNLNARWGEMQAFGPVMRSHETNKPRLNQQIYSTETTRQQFAKSSRIYAALHTYRKGVIDEAVAKGIPAMRHAWLVYPGTAVAKQDVHFFLGDHLFAAPVISEDATTVDVVFPPGRWRHILTGKVYSGSRTVDAPIGTPAAFVRVGDPVGDSIIKEMKRAGLYR